MHTWTIILITVISTFAAIITISSFWARTIHPYIRRKAQLYLDPDEPLIASIRNSSEIQKGLEVLTDEIEPGAFETIVAINSGGAIIGGMLSKALNIPITSLTRDTSNELMWSGPKEAIDGKKIILVDDVVHTGRTIRSAVKYIEENFKPTSYEVAVLVDTVYSKRHSNPIHVDYRVFTTKESDIKMPWDFR